MAANNYELTYIVNGVLSDDQIRQTVQRIRRIIEENGGEIIEIDEWGTRRLAYPINKKRNGFFVNLYFSGSGELVSRLERALEIDDDVLRYLTLRMDSKMLRYYEQQKASERRARAEEGKTVAAAAVKSDDEDDED